MRRFWFRRGLRFLGFAILFVGLAGLAVMTLWNALLPAIFGVTTISWLQALGLLVLSRILFGGRGFGPRGHGPGWRRGGFGRRGFGRRGFGRREFGPGQHEWRQKMAARWEKMTPEQREEMRRQWRDRCGKWGRGRWGHPKTNDSDKDEPKPTAI